MAKKKHLQGTCVYCNQEDLLTLDHVIPQCLFTNGLPIDVPKVYACEPCNGVLKSGADAYLRDFLALDMNSNVSPLGSALIPKFERAAGRNQSPLAKEFVEKSSQSQPLPIYTPSGLFGGFAYATELSNGKLKEAMTFIVRGLYYYYSKKIFPQDLSFTVSRASDLEKTEKNAQTMMNYGAICMRPGDGGVFQGLYLGSPDFPNVSGWMLEFYYHVVFVVFTGFPIKKQIDGEEALDENTLVNL